MELSSQIKNFHDAIQEITSDTSKFENLKRRRNLEM